MNRSKTARGAALAVPLASISSMMVSPVVAILSRAPGSRRARRALCAVTLCVFVTGAAQATTLSWVGNDGFWDDPANWAPAVVPQTGDHANLVQSDATSRTVRVRAATPGTLAQVTVDAAGSGDMTLLHDVSPPGDGLAADFIVVGNAGRGTLLHSAGQLTAGTILTLGQMSSGSGVYDLAGGVLSAGQVRVGSAGEGSFQHSGGTANVSLLDVASQPGGNGSYRLSGGVINAPGAENIGMSFGDPARRLFAQTGGQNNTGQLSVGNATYDLQAGNLAASALLLGQAGVGRFAQSGGDTQVSDSLVLGTYDYLGLYQGHGDVDLGGGSLRARDERLGYDWGRIVLNPLPPVRFAQTGGTNTVVEHLVVGESALSTATYELSGAGILKITGQSRGRYFWGNEVIGDSGTGIFSQTGGTHTVDSRLDLILGLQTIGGEGRYALSDGTLSAGTEILGKGGHGVFEQSGGAHTVTTLYLGGDYNRYGLTTGSGSYALSGGALSAQVEKIGSTGGGDFTQDGGTNHVLGLTLGNFSSGSGSYHLGGTGLLDSRTVKVGFEGAGDFTQDGGLHTNTYLQVGSFGGAGMYHLTNGTLQSLSIGLGTAGGFDFAGGRLAVDRFWGDLVNQGGTLAPGNSPGTTRVMGDYRQAAGGTFEVEIGSLGAGSGYDQLLVDGTAWLDGALDVMLLSGFSVAVGDAFDIVVAQTVSGAFSSLVLPDLGLRNMHFSIDYLLDATGDDIVRLSVLSGSRYDANVTPEPSTLVLFALGLVGLASARRRLARH